ncbi:hypothetical protein SAMN04489712_102239 [Thermomonospora echinospora]|uniref:2-phospho-L-lactate guanylyltransferase n=1 Tax=Thermomonospora echinospora TaxID=1992 RepID=A0A1H5VAC3_9ACTN|nr:hypothetical protein [Thermomonospora echinospora]SEF84312.1 hypothetical protein SAMN04489712_102239 [Thermomonospora echinospora]
MTTRFTAVLAMPPPGRAAPPGVDPDELRLAMLEDVYEVVAGLELVTPALVLHPPHQPDAEAVTWPGTPILREPDPAAALQAMADLGAEEAALVVPDAPDLPPLLIGKLFRALGSAPAAACPATGGGLVALAVRLPVPGWLAEALPALGAALDAPDALARLRTAAPGAGLVRKTPGWHRLRDPADLGLLDPGLEGWENTRALLASHPLPAPPH